MEFIEREIKGVFEIRLSAFTDERGFFMRTFDNKVFHDAGVDFDWVQENHSRTEQKGTIRGLHFQFPPFAETKLVRCIRGSVFDVFVDLRQGSPTFGRWGSVELSEQNKKMILIPRGLAHGFCTLTQESEVLYKVDNFYSKPDEGGLLWNDKELAIGWPVVNPLLSEKDRKNLTLKAFIARYNALNV